MAGLVVTTEPTQEPVTLQEVKEYLRVEDSTDERTIRPLIETARRFAEEHLGLALVSTTFTQYYDALNDAESPLWEGTRTGPYLNTNRYARQIIMVILSKTSLVKIWNNIKK